MPSATADLTAHEKPMPPTLSPAKPTSDAAALDARARKAQEQLDAHVRDTVEWHFNPATGSPFWLEKQKEWGLDVRKEVRSFADLRKLPHFEDDWLRGGPVRRWMPKGLEGKAD